MKYDFQVIKRIFKKDSFSIFSCMPLDDYNDLHIHPQYQNFTIKGDDLMLVEGQSYSYELEFVNDKYGTTYKISDSNSIFDLNEFNDDMDYALLSMITTESQAKYVHDAYPNFCQLILNGRESEIDVNKIYNVKHSKLQTYIGKIKEQFESFSILTKLSEYKITVKEANLLNQKYGKDIDLIVESITENPYKVLINDCERGFYPVDKLLLEIKPELKISNQRCEALCLDILESNENNHNSTYMIDKDIAEYVAGYDEELLSVIVDTIVTSCLIHYDKEKHRVSRDITFMHEKNIAKTLNKIMSNNSILNELQWKKFKTIKDGVLTDEQSELLHMFCTNNIVILNAKGGTGKTSSVLALLDMLDDYGFTYKLFSPTGKAAKRLSESTFKNASTIHRGTKLGTAELYEDVLIIDEMSMLTLETMYMICKCIKNDNVRLVLVGDLNQLPPIGLGFVANELIESGKVPVITLSKVFRFNSSGMAYVTTLACDGIDYTEKMQEIDAKTHENKDYEYLPYQSPNQVINTYLRLISHNVDVKDVVIITPRNTGELGTYNLNNMIQEKINPVKDMSDCFIRKINGTEIKFHKDDLVLVTKNKYDMYNLENYRIKMGDVENENEDIETSPIFNGEIGKVLSVNTDTMNVLIDNEIIVFESPDVDNLLLGYVLTTWKMQGSESLYTIILTLKEHKSQLNRQLLYTGLSRARKQVIEIGDINATKFALSHIGLLDYKCQIAEILKGEI